MGLPNQTIGDTNYSWQHGPIRVSDEEQMTGGVTPLTAVRFLLLVFFVS